MKRNSQLHTPQRSDQLAFFVVATLLVCVSLGYVYFVGASIFHVASRAEVDQKIREQQSLISELEAEYIAAQHSVSSDIASLAGFVRNPKKIYLDTRGSSLVLLQN